MIRKKKLFSRPKKAYEKKRIEDENVLVEKYGLKNKREIWKALARINYFRSRAKALAKVSDEEQQVLFTKLTDLGLPVASIADVLALKVENLLDRRLPTIIARKGLTLTTKQARQQVVHKNVLIDGRAVDVPSYIVSVAEESKIALKHPLKHPPKEKAESKENKEQTE